MVKRSDAKGKGKAKRLLAPFSARLRRILWGESCVSCGGRDAKDEILCSACAAKFQRKLAEVCPDCGSPRIECRCAPPRLRDAGCRFLVKLAAYDSSQPDCPLNRMINRLKHIRDRECAAFLAELLADSLKALISEQGVEPGRLTVTYIPRDPDKILLEGHDQARMLAVSLADRLGLECRPLLRRSRGSSEQKELTAEEREKNVRRLFSLSPHTDRAGLEGEYVILVDDLVTTGATAAACVRLLFDAGCSGVYGAAAAYTPLKPATYGNDRPLG